MKLGVSSYSFTGVLKTGQYKLIDIPALAKEIGFEVIEFVPMNFPENVKPEEYAAKLKEECKKVGIEIGNYTVAGDFLSGCDGDLEAEIERLKGEVRIAQILGSPGMRHDATWGIPEDSPHHISFDDVLPRLIIGCRAITEYAETLGIKTMVENHGYFAQDSDRVEKLVSGVAHKNFGLLMDMGNFMCADEIPSQSVGKCVRYASHIHAKDFHTKSGSDVDPGEGWFPSRAGNYLRGAVIGHGDANILQCLKIIKKSGYEGTVSIEFEGIEDSVKGVTMGFANLKRFVSLCD